MEDWLYYFHVNGGSQVYIHIYIACDRGDSSNSVECQRQGMLPSEIRRDSVPWSSVL